ncbi:DUF998 domain-containing protein [Actinoplanes subglobosus]|uniref:DUF998 domain-containing protein n=1 Tax=Actinoplanes subglobosus TaxID=1547892 RepID=A0ABV8IZS6_9ACTN
MPDRRHVAVLAGLAGYVLCTVTADLVNPDWSPVETMISHYVHARAGWLIPAALLALAAASALLTRLVEPVAPRAALVPLRIWTAAVTVGAVFPADPYGRWDQPPTVPGLLHGLAALTAFTVLPGAAVSLTLARRPITRPAAVLAALTVPAYLLLLAAFADVQDGPSVTVGGWESLIGATERLMLWIYVGWLAVTAAVIRPPATAAPPVRAGRH